VDRPSVSIPYIYVLTGMELAQLFRDRGQAADARATFEVVKQVARATRLEAMIQDAEVSLSSPAPSGDSARGTTLRVDQSSAPVTRSSEPGNQGRRGRP
jgi:hypothetical protein